MGLPPISTEYEYEEKPYEGNEDGCPGGWYRCPFFASVQKYLRHGDRDNPLLATCDDRLVREAVSFYDYQAVRAS